MWGRAGDPAVLLWHGGGQTRHSWDRTAQICPTLLVRGGQSDLLSEEGARHFLSLAPHAEFVDVEGAGHVIAGDRNDLFNDAVTGFLNGHR